MIVHSLIFIQIKKIKLIRAKIFPAFGYFDVTEKDLLLVRTSEEKYWIQVIHRLTGDLINEIESMCDHHQVCLNKYPQNQDFVFECCRTCKEIYTHNINTGESLSVHRGSEIVDMWDGPAGSLLVLNRDWKLFKLVWDKAQDGAQLVFVQEIPDRIGKKYVVSMYCYVECGDICIYTVKDEKDDTNYEIIAVRLGSENIVWSLSGPVDGLFIKPRDTTCDTDGDVCVMDRAANRILKIDGLTGEVLSILLFQEQVMIQLMRWSNTEPNLTVRENNQTSVYLVPK